MIDYWITKDRKQIALKKMTTEHIQNCIKAIQDGRINCVQEVFVDYTCDGDGDGKIYDYIDRKEEFLKSFRNELKRRNNVL